MLRVVDDILACDALLLLEEASVACRLRSRGDREGGGRFEGTGSAGNVEGCGSALEEQLAASPRVDALPCEREKEEPGQEQGQEVRV